MTSQRATNKTKAQTRHYLLRLVLSGFQRSHRCRWETTHVNGYYHPMEQRCRKCGKTRMAVRADAGGVRAWDWLYDDGHRSIRTRGWDGPTDWGSHFGFPPEKEILLENTEDRHEVRNERS